MFRKTFVPLTILILVMAWIFAGRAEAQLRPSTLVLLPYFEVDTATSGRTTMFAVGNALSQPVDIQIEVRTNWGIPVVTLPAKLAAHEVKTFNLRDWIVQGKLPNKALKQADKAQLKAALSGLKAPQDNLYYATAVAPNLAVGSVVIRVVGGSIASALWGDFMLVDPALNISMGDDLVNLERASCGSWLCNRHALRFLSGTALSLDTRVVIWTDRSAQPSKTVYPESQKLGVDGIAYNEAGQPIGDVGLHLLPLQVVSVSSLGLKEPFGWIDLRSQEPTFIGLQFDTTRRDGAALQAYCLKDDPGPDPGIEIVKRTNGEDANSGPGPKIPVGSPVLWEYDVRNTGSVRLTKVKVTDDDSSLQVSCPKDTLDAGQSMVCTAKGSAVACQYQNIGTAIGTQPNGAEVEAADPSHYFGGQNAKIDVELAVNGEDADESPGIGVAVGDPLHWTYLVTNTGDVQLTDVKVTDDTGIVPSCGKTSLRPGESVTCTASSTAVSNGQPHVGAAAAKGPCGDDTKDSDPANYTTRPVTFEPRISIVKKTNGDDANDIPGPTIKVGDPVQWTYIVTNSGDVNLTNVQVTDNRGVTVTCPKTSLQKNEVMTCFGNGIATAGQYANIGTVTGNPPTGSAVTASDPSHYFGQEIPPPPCGIKIKKYTNGDDADAAPGPTIPVGGAVHWTYVVSNPGQVVLSNIKVTDDRGVAVTCPKNSLQPSEAMTCTGNGIATAGQYANIGTAVGTPPSGPDATHSDPSHYYGQPPTGGQGCTPGYWKNHTDSWPPTGYAPSQKVQSVFAQASNYPTLGNASLLDALYFNGGSTLEGAAGNLLRASVAALLDSAHPNVNYPRSPAGVISDANAALASGNRDTMLSVASQLDADNNLGCPLN